MIDCVFNNDEMTCPVCGKKGRSRTARSNCLPQTTAAELSDMRDRARAILEQSGLPPPVSSGPGTELKKLLAKVGINASPTCSCNARARRMDVEESREPGWCEGHLDEIVGWLREEAGKRGLPFIDLAGRMLVRRAISRARAIERGAENSRSHEG